MHTSRFDRLARTLAAATHRRQVISGLLAAAFGAPAGAAAQEAAPATPRATPAADDTEKWLYIQAFESATLAPDPTAPDAYALTLTGVGEDVLGISEPPEREVATVTTTELADMMVGQLLNPLDATLVATRADGGRAAVLVEVWSSELVVAAGTVTYWVGMPEADEQPAGTPLAGPPAEQAFGPGHLFLEGCKPGCCLCPGGCTCNEQKCANLCL